MSRQAPPAGEMPEHSLPRAGHGVPLRHRLPAFLFVFGLAGCVTTPKPAPVHPLPDGLYRHDVRVEVKNLPPQEFHGVLHKTGDALSLVLLTPFDTTLVRISDRLSVDEPKVEAYADEIREHQGHIEALYLGLKPALVDLAATSTEAFGHTGTVQHKDLDAKGIPRETVISGDGFHIDVTVSHYEEARHP